MATFGDPAILKSAKATINVEGYKFHADGKEIAEEGWIRYYSPYFHSVTRFLPQLREGGRVALETIEIDEEFTKPPPRYNPSTILKRMHKEGVGTKATRAGIIETLYDRKYIREERIEMTDLGFEVIDVLSRHCSAAISPELTRILEEKMNMIQQEKEKRENVIGEVIESLKPVAERLKEKEQEIGEQLSQALKKSRLEERAIGACHACKTGKLLIVTSRKTGKRFVGCSGYFEDKCKTAFPLPQRGFVKPSGGACRNCGWPIVRILTRNKRPWNLCFNPECLNNQKGSHTS
jgi:DNA topoisomerase-1